MTSPRVAALTACAVVLLAACGSSSKTGAAPAGTDPPTTLASTSTIPPNTRPRASIGFREVTAQYPWAAEPSTSEAADAFPGCAKLIQEAPPYPAAEEQTVLPARNRDSCFVVGPVLVDGEHVESAAVFDSTASQWGVEVHFDNDDFLDKIAGPLVGKQIAIDVDGVVQSAPTINPGITGRDVQITGNFTKQEAIDAAASILGVSPSSVPVDSADAPD